MRRRLDDLCETGDASGGMALIVGRASMVTTRPAKPIPEQPAGAEDLAAGGAVGPRTTPLPCSTAAHAVLVRPPGRLSGADLPSTAMAPSSGHPAAAKRRAASSSTSRATARLKAIDDWTLRLF